MHAGTLYSVIAETPLGFFALERDPSPWWPKGDVGALYLSAIVVAPAARGLGVGGRIVEWCSERAVGARLQALRLDCHASNAWLRAYYEGFGFVQKEIVEQHPGYFGCLYELETMSCRV